MGSDLKSAEELDLESVVELDLALVLVWAEG